MSFLNTRVNSKSLFLHSAEKLVKNLIIVMKVNLNNVNFQYINIYKEKRNF